MRCLHQYSEKRMYQIIVQGRRRCK